MSAVIAVGITVSLVVSTAPAAATTAKAAVTRPVAPPPTSPGPAVTKVKPLEFRFTKPRDDADENFVPNATAWPKPARASIRLAAPAAKAREGTTSRGVGVPVWAKAVAADTGHHAGPEAVEAQVLDQATARAADIAGVLLTVTPAGRTGKIQIGIDYAGFAGAYGGNYGSRLRLVQLPGCAITTPQLASCRRATPLNSTNDTATQAVSAPLTLDKPATPVVLAAVADAGDEGADGGTYAATDLKPSASWAGGGSTGSFTYSYPITVPPAASSLVPNVGLNYDSGSVDGQTAATQAQASWVGDGWTTPKSFIEQTFTSCADEPGGSPSPEPTPDRCHNGPILTMSLNGTSTALVWDSGKQVWRPQAEDGSVITHVVNSGNGSGTYNSDYWRVTTRNGTVYEFGRNRLPGWSSGKSATNSVDKVPVYSPHSGDPCYNSSGFSASVCDMAYRWNLDHVVDVHGNAMAYYYKQDTNLYGRNEGAVNDDYVRDSYLDRIDYGFRAGGAYGTPPNRVVFGVGPRCVTGTCTPLNDSTKANWPDVPYDLICASGTCSSRSPSFFSTVRLTSIAAQQWSTTTSSYVNVDSYALSQTIPATGDGNAPTLWLASITRTGHDITAGGSTAPITLPSVSFTSIKLPNRVDPAGVTAFYRHRLESITTEAGSEITASYELPQPCTAPVTLNPATNARSCYPVYWTPDGYTEPFRDWFHRYAVTRVTATDPTGGAPDTSTNYSYVGGAAWHYDENEVVKKKYRTYGQFRGYGTVRTLDGDGINDPQTLSQTTYYRGMSKNNSSAVVNVTDSAGGVHEDLDQLAGKELETTAYLGNGGPVDHSTITSYWMSAATASRARTGLPALTANWVAPVLTYTRQAVTAGGTATWRYTGTDNAYDASVTSPTVGVLKHSYTHTVPPDPAYDRCTTNTYTAGNAAKNLIGLVSQVETVSVACGGYTAGSPASTPGAFNTLTAPSSVNRPAQVVSARRTYYDDMSWTTTFPQAAAPVAGDVTMTRKAADYSNGAYTWQTVTRTAYDGYGRPVDVYDGNGNKTSAGYIDNSIGLTTGITQSNLLGHTTSTTLNTQRGLTLTGTDANGVVTTQQYDALGRTTSVWLYSRATTTPANYKFSYLLQKTGVTATTTERMNDLPGEYVISTTIYDAQLRLRQSQATTPQSGRVITDKFYDSRGWVRSSNNGWWHSGATPDTTPVKPDQVSPHPLIPNQSFYTYDGLGRVVIDVAANDGIEVSRTTTVYNGDRTTVIPPEGDIVKTTVTDPIGRTGQLLEYHVKPTLNTPANTFTGIFSVTGGTAAASTYGYDSHGNQNSLTDADSNTWTSTYNLLGQVIAKTDPDAGATTGITYDGNGNPTQSTDSRGKTISYIYDSINRKTGKFAASTTAQSTANQLAAWVYDNSNNAIPGMRYPKGQLTTATSYQGGSAYTVQQRNFNVFGKSLGQTVTIPAVEGLLAGSYTFIYAYTLTAGLLNRTVYPSRGGLPAETVDHLYATKLDLPDTLAGNATYADGVTYDAWGRVLQERIGGSPNLAYLDNSYDPHTGRVAQQLVQRPGTTVEEVDRQEYQYDKAGNITRQVSTRLGSTSTSETQCFRYDSLRRLTQAWTATDACTVTPTPTSRSTVGSNLGGASTYWTSWEFDLVGNRTKQTQYSTTGGADTTTTYTYDGNGAGQPHTLTGAATAGATTGSATYGYDSAGNMTSRNAGNGNQTLTWNDAGRLGAINGSTAGNSNFLYDADGNLLLQKDPGATTLYLPGQQLTLNTTTQAVTGVRHYALPGGGMAIRTGAGTSYTFAITDRHGTPTLYLDSTAQTPTWRQYTPYGDSRGVISAWPDNRGFLNKPINAATGLAHVGAREYDTTIGRFVSIDPIMNMIDPQQWNGYAYSGNNPTTFSDPSGLIPEDCSQFECNYAPGCEGCNKNKKKNDSCWPAKNCQSTQKNNPDRGGEKLPTGEIAPPRGEMTLELWSELVRGTHVSNLNSIELHNARWDVLCYNAPDVCKAMRDDTQRDVNNFLLDLVGYTDAKNCANGSVGGCVMTAIGVVPHGKLKALGPIGEAIWKGTRAACSFSADTEVLMADGSTKPMKGIKIGDEVLATDPETGQQGPRRVTHLWIHQDQLVALELANGEHITTTEDHPFWNKTDKQWQQAQDLDPGDTLHASSGAPVSVIGLDWATTYTGTAYNLTIDQIHTYYVLAGDTPVLVHNSNCGNLFKGDGWQHVVYEHVDGSPGVVPGNTTFSNYLDLDDIGDLIQDTARTTGRPNTPDPLTGLPRDGTIHTVNFGYPVGSRGETFVEVILNPNGSLRTAYPR